jgi:hypothetical protein
MDLSQVQVDRLHLIFDMPTEGILQVTELWILSNLGDRTVGDELGEGNFLVTLPEGAANLGFEGGTSNERFQASSDGNSFTDRLAIRPGVGSHEIVFSFNLVVDDDSLDFSQPLEYPVEAVVLLAPQGVVSLEGDRIEDLGLRQMSGASLQNYSAGPLSAGDELAFRVKRDKSSQSTEGDSGKNVGLVIGVSLLLVALAATGYWLDRRLQKRDDGMLGATEEPETDVVVLEESQDREALLQQLADLDDAFDAGEIDEDDYQRQRTSLKNQLMKIL